MLRLVVRERTVKMLASIQYNAYANNSADAIPTFFTWLDLTWLTIFSLAVHDPIGCSATSKSNFGFCERAMNKIINETSFRSKRAPSPPPSLPPYCDQVIFKLKFSHWRSFCELSKRCLLTTAQLHSVYILTEAAMMMMLKHSYSFSSSYQHNCTHTHINYGQ